MAVVWNLSCQDSTVSSAAHSGATAFIASAEIRHSPFWQQRRYFIGLLPVTDSDARLYLETSSGKLKYGYRLNRPAESHYTTPCLPVIPSSTARSANSPSTSPRTSPRK